MSSSRLRWLVKKSARKIVAGASTLRRIAPIAPRPSLPTVRVLTYHRFGETLRDPFCVRVDDFDRQMATLAELGTATTLADVEAFLAGRKQPRGLEVLVTIDDGCPSFFFHALPILMRHRIPAVLFVPSGELKDECRPHSNIERETDRMTWKQLEETAQAGIVIGSHGWTHESLGRMSLDAAETQIIRSRAELEQRLQRPVTAFAYPYGTQADYSARIADRLRRAGYSCAFTSQHGPVQENSDPWTLPRVKIEGGESLWMFQASTRGALDNWRWIDRTLWMVQQGSRVTR